MRSVVTDSGVLLVFDAPSFAGIVVFLTAAILVGSLSQRYLRPMGDMPGMAELRWGAHWFGRITAIAITVVYVGMWLGVDYTSYPLTTLALARSGMMAAILLPIILLPTQSDGWLLGLLVMVDSLRFRPRNYRDWVIARRERGGRQGYEWVILAVLLAGPLAALSGVTYNSYQTDVRDRALRQVDTARQAVADALAGGGAAEVTAALAPGPEQIVVHIRAADDTPIERLQAIRDAAEVALGNARLRATWQVTVLTRDQHMHEVIREALQGEPLARVVATRALGGEVARIDVAAGQSADEETVQRMGDKVDRALAELGEADAWQINVTVGGMPEHPQQLPADMIPRAPYSTPTATGGQ